ncbi:glycosyl transferase [Seonamhaeicola sp. S2-3]|uniref:glycosyltransferase n=1 Tax=Seonamhaeicola sp. S2-3 TaxID=1936081 RepID=UPI00097294F2|nr:glycosyltransferase [Seonamhaeicola sp. S2-3]APY09991.1 glycosyl transferase [Seonamhaeicola sp. S2-3]
MKFLIITHVLHKKKDDTYFGYAPYVREMNLWLNHVDEVHVVAPLIRGSISEIDLAYKHASLHFTEIPQISFISAISALRSVFKLPTILYAIYKACKKADHIHLRCPGNIGLLGCLVQLFFPKKIKTAKYAGNWDPKAQQPLSYKFQKWLLSNTFLTKNMQVLVYGQWEHQTKNIKPFFTASFYENDIEDLTPKDYTKTLHMVFVGSLVAGKKPLFAIQLVEQLIKQGKRVCLNMYGDGVLRQALQDYINHNNLKSFVFLHGNQSKNVIKNALKQAHFSILPSKSEGWPKAIAEAMFFGVIPIATKVSCVPYMLDFGNRGILIEPEVDLATQHVLNHLKDIAALEAMSKLAATWSQNYTLDYFDSEIKKLIIN